MDNKKAVDKKTIDSAYKEFDHDFNRLNKLVQELIASNKVDEVQSKVIVREIANIKIKYIFPRIMISRINEGK